MCVALWNNCRCLDNLTCGCCFIWRLTSEVQAKLKARPPKITRFVICVSMKPLTEVFNKWDIASLFLAGDETAGVTSELHQSANAEAEPVFQINGARNWESLLSYNFWGMLTSLSRRYSGWPKGETQLPWYRVWAMNQFSSWPDGPTVYEINK